MHNNILTISGEKRHEAEKKSKNSYYKASSYMSFSRNMPLRGHVDKAKMKSAFEHGMFTLTLPRK